MSFSGTGAEVSVPAPGSDPSAQPRIFTTESQSFELPSFFTLAASYDLYTTPAYRVTALGALQNNNFQGNAIRGGLELSYRDLGALRGSYFGSYRGSTDPNTGEDQTQFTSGDDLYTGFAIGGGLKMRTGETGHLGVDLTWRPVRQGLFDDTIDFGLKLSF
jgi:hypothetical protein